MRRAIPEGGDVVIREIGREGKPVYVLRIADGPDQLLLRARARAVRHAVTFARCQAVRAWLTGGGSDFTLLGDFRPPVGELPPVRWREHPRVRTAQTQHYDG